MALKKKSAYKKALVTGADGFIGSHLVEFLLKEDFRVRALSYYNSFNYWGWLEELKADPRLEIVSGDIRDAYFCKNLCKDVDIIYHLAALIAIPYSYIAPDGYIDTNVKGTLNICQAAKENKNVRLIHTSTSEVYGTAQYVPIDEKHPKQPQSPYSASKIGSDAIAMSFYHSFNLPVTIARPFNTYGPRQSARAVIPTIITQIASGVKKIKLGHTTPTRDLVFVKDLCNGLLLLSQNNTTIGKEINICSGKEISIKALFMLIKDIMKKNVSLVEDKCRFRPKASEVYRLLGDNTLIKELTGFKCQYDIRKGIEITCKWFSDPKNLKKYKTHIYNI
jgi:NAD dependent epimerase/dehydratase